MKRRSIDDLERRLAELERLVKGFISTGQVRCHACGATAREIREGGHRKVGRKSCPEACTCIPEHFSMAAHWRAVARERQRAKRGG